MFIGRKNELQFLEECYHSNKAELVVLYGRRRVGKTELINVFCKDKPHFYYACREYTDIQQLQSFTDKIHSYHIPSLDLVGRFEDWEKAFLSVLQLPTDQKKILVIDEFPHICKSNPSVPSILQILWDEKLRHENVMIILSGSAMSFIEKDILSEKNPLYGRTTATYKVLPLPYTDAIKFFPNYSDEDKLIAYSILGGIPYYLTQFDPDKSVKQNVLQQILRRGCTLYNEVEFLMKQELREPSIYNTVIEAIATGCNSFNDILQRTKIDKSKLSVYLKNLLELSVVDKEFPVLATKNEKVSAQKGSYILTDNFFRFWYAFAYRNLTDLEANAAELVWDTEIADELHNFASRSFEVVCKDYLLLLSRQKLLPFRITDAGRYWGKKTVTTNNKTETVPVEIDLMACDRPQKNFILGECKFTNSPFDLGQVKTFMDKLKPHGTVLYFLFSLSGFTEAVQQFAQSENIQLVTAHDIATVSD